MPVASFATLLLLLGALPLDSSASADGITFADVARGKVEDVAAALARGVKVDAPIRSEHEREARTPLIVAAETQRLDMVRFLVSRGADVERRVGTLGWSSAFEYAFRGGQVEMASFLLDAASNPSQAYLAHVLFNALEWRTKGAPEYQQEPTDDTGIALARRALARGLKAGEREVRRAFFHACVEEDLRALDLLLDELRVDPNLPGELFADEINPHEYDPPLIEAASYQRLEAVRRLLDHGAKIDVAVRGGTTALHAAASQQRTEVVALLLARGANPAARDAEGHTAAWVARRHRQRAVLEAFAKAGVPATAAEEAEVAALEAQDAREEAARRAEYERKERGIDRMNLAIKGGAFAAWALYLGASVAARRAGADSALGRAGTQINLWAGPLMGGAGVGTALGIGFTFAFSSGHGGIPNIADPRGPGGIAGLVTLATLGALNFVHRNDLASHPWLYYAGPVLSIGIPIGVTALRLGR